MNCHSDKTVMSWTVYAPPLHSWHCSDVTGNYKSFKEGVPMAILHSVDIRLCFRSPCFANLITTLQFIPVVKIS